MKTKFKGIVWLGIRTDKFKETIRFYEDILGLAATHDETGFKAYKLPNDDTIEIFSTDFKSNQHFTSGPVVGFLVDDIAQVKKEMLDAGIEFIGDIQGNPNKSQWAHFKGPDGNIYELKAFKE